ncbi:DUF6049 family protein [Bifidobacterium biavatii]|uniref:Secreted protein n=1 Tax=Bifidobacterium biavatii DSM 23969 TaxID=1437608 RepID=A0A086ZSP8_9BIFI|nr:DUF6049 family protein [Bifidobacterium biavatii]KFI49548.1 hypothetical protein BBIA_0975 [Bifidobacterium biavatii DSM 23969]
MNPTAARATARITKTLRALLALALAVAMCAAVVAWPAQASADETGDDANAGTGITIAIDAVTAVVTATSGYQLKATVSNGSQDALPAGTLDLSANLGYIFNSRTDMQEWSQGDANIPMMDDLGSVAVPALTPGASTAVTVSASKESLERIATWGPKPIRVSYVSGDELRAQTHSFLTRSSDGLNTINTPALNLTIAMPLRSSAWQVSDTAFESLASGSLTSSTSAATIVTLGEEAKADRVYQQLLAKHPALQIIADPTMLAAMDLPTQVSGVMQPSGFDMSAYGSDNAGAYEAAGVTSSAWNADAALADYRSALGDQQASTSVVAWQGKANWSLASLTEAKRQGYSIVIANHEFDNSDDSTVHTGKIVVPTDAGDVTVLTQQRVLSRLAQGKATSDSADAEQSMAGRIARFVAQSAFYQMEQPYTTRSLLVCMNANASGAMVDALMSAAESASWLKLTNLSTLSKVDAFASGDDALGMVDDTATLTDAQSSALTGTLSTLASDRDQISRFVSSVLVADGKSTQWSNQLLAAQSTLALHAMSGDKAVVKRMTDGAAKLAARLLGGVTITPSESLTVVSETAKMPVTLSNALPYAVRVKISSITDSMEIVTSRNAETEIPARSEAQVTFSIRVSTSGSANATIALQDRNGQAFGEPQTKRITSVLQINDMSGFVIIGFAVVLGLLGLWRQFHRKKDPDE